MLLPALLHAAELARRDDAAAEKLGWHLATKAYTFRTLTLAETIEITGSLGLKYFEMDPNQKLSPDDPTPINPKLSLEKRAEVKKMFSAAGIQPISIGVLKLNPNEAEIRSWFQLAKDLGLREIICEPPAEAVPIVSKLCDEFQMDAAIHNHPKPSHYAEPEVVLAAIQGQSARLGACTDVGHWTRSGLNTVDCLHKMQGHIVSLHFKDVDAHKKDVPWGDRHE